MPPATLATDRTSQNRQKGFEFDPARRDGVNAFGETISNLTERRFDALANMRSRQTLTLHVAQQHALLRAALPYMALGRVTTTARNLKFPNAIALYLSGKTRQTAMILL